jgi:hypothetical protein
MTNQNWEKVIAKKLVGRKIVDIRYLTVEEAEMSGWNNQPICLFLDNGEWIVPMSDDEGNDGGAMATSYEKLSTIPVMRG